MGPWNWRSSLSLELWTEGLSYREWVRQTPREHRRIVLRAWIWIWWTVGTEWYEFSVSPLLGRWRSPDGSLTGQIVVTDGRST